MKNRVLLCLVIALSLTNSLSARNFYVSAAGNNSNSGLTQATAWQTIGKVNSYFASMAAGDSILFRRGDVFFGAIIVGKSGTSTMPISIGAYGTGAKPVISGFVTVSSWSLVSPGIYQALVSGAKSTLNMVALNDIPQAVGRYPNSDAANGGYLSYETYSGSTSITDNELDASTSWVGAEIVIRKKLWVLDRCKVTAQSGGTFTFTNTNSSTYSGTNGFGYFLQNDPRTLDKMGEWHFNGTTKYLQFYFGTASPSSYTVKVSCLDTLLYMSSKNYINIENVTFEGANVNALIASSSSYVSIKNCDFANAGTTAISATSTGNLLIENCTVKNILSNAIIVNSSKNPNVTIRGCTVKNTATIPGMGLSNGNSYKGIYAFASNLLIENNRVDTTGYVGIEFQGSNVTVKNNVVNYFDIIKDDAAGIYTYSGSTDASPGTIYTNRVIRENIVMNGMGAPKGRNSSTLYASGIYLDGRAVNVDVINNTVFNNAKNGIHCSNAQNVNIRGNTSYNNLTGVSCIRWANVGEIRNLSIKNNILYTKTDAQRNLYYVNSGLNEPVATTVNEQLRVLGKIDSNYFSLINPTGFVQEVYATTGGAWIQTTPLSLEGWRAATLHDTISKKVAKVPTTYKLNSLVGANKFTNGLFTSNVTGITVSGAGVTSAWDNTGRISGGSLKLTFTSPAANKYATLLCSIGAVSSAKQYVLRFSTYGANQQGFFRAHLRKTTSPYTALTPIQVRSFGAGRKDHEILFAAPTTDAGATFVIEVEQNSGITYIDNVDFYEVTAKLYDINSQLRFEYNDTKIAKTISLDGRHTAVDGTVYSTSYTLQPFTSVILVKDTGNVAFSATATATTIKCYGDSATVTVAATGGTTPYTGTGTFKVVAGNYTYTVTDAAGATTTATVAITQPASALTATATAGTISIAGGTTTITVTATGGTSPYSGTGVFTVLAGTYTYTVTDANGCTSAVSKTVTDGVGPFTLTVTTTPTAGGTVTGAGSYTAGAIATLVATPAAGYTFTGWSGTVTGTASTITVTMSANRSVTATFTPITYTLTGTASPTAGGTIAGTGTYTSGATATVTATPAAGYTFTGWSGAATGTTNPVTVSMTANKSITATFTAITYTLTATATPTAGGTVAGGGTYAYNATATLTATPAAGYVFSGWSGAVTGTATTITVAMNANKSVTATFTAAAVTYTLTGTASPTAGGTITGTGTYASGATATLTATAAAGYTFSGWSGSVTGTTNPVTVSMTANRSVTATFTPITYTLATTATPTAGGTVAGGGTYASGATATLTATPAAGYTFTGWSGAVTGTATTVTVSMTANRSVTATFTPITYTLTTTATPTAGGTIAGGGTYAYNATATLTATPAAGYVFSGWSGAVTGTATTVTVSMTANRSVTATFTPITYTLTTTATPTAGGTVAGGGTYAYNATATLTATPAAGYVFSGWSGAVTGTATTITVAMNANKSVTATFTAAAVTYSLTGTASPTAGGTITGTGTYASGATATLTATAAAGYTFSGWSGSATGTTNPVTVSMTANRSVTATFTPITYTLTTTASPTAGGAVTGAGTYNSGTTATLTATPAAGYTFTGWSGAATGTTNPVTVSMTANRSVTATFTPITYTLTTIATPTAGGTVAGGGTYAYNATATLTATPAAGYVFSGWSGAVTGTATTITVAMNANKSVTATFTAAAVTYSLTGTASPTIGGTIAGTGTYTSGATATLTATPAWGYVFTGWSGAVTGTTNPVTVSMTANRLVTAIFTQISYTLTGTASPTAGGTIAGTGSYLSGSTATVTATPATGYTFSGWSGSATGTTNPVTVLMTDNRSVTATFTPVSYTLTATANPTAGGTVTGAGSYNYGTTATLTATPNAGYTFTGWSGDATGTATIITISINGNKSVVATFVASSTPTTLHIEDDSIGTRGFLCSIQGSVSNNSGAANRRSINLTNSLAKGLNWSVDAGATGTYNLKWRYANGSTSNTFFMKLIINGVVIDDSVPFPKTTGSSTFVTTTGDYPLTAGNNTIRLESIEARATADVDWMEVTGINPTAGDCMQTGARPAATSTTTSIATTSKTKGVYPNPANGAINIGFDVSETQRVSFVILDAAGKPVGNINGQIYPAGYNLQSYNIAGKKPGIYTVLVSGDKNLRQAYKFVVVQ